MGNLNIPQSTKRQSDGFIDFKREPVIRDFVSVPVWDEFGQKIPYMETVGATNDTYYVLALDNLKRKNKPFADSYGRVPTDFVSKAEIEEIDRLNQSLQEIKDERSTILDSPEYEYAVDAFAYEDAGPTQAPDVVSIPRQEIKNNTSVDELGRNGAELGAGLADVLSTTKKMADVQSPIPGESMIQLRPLFTTPENEGKIDVSVIEPGRVAVNLIESLASSSPQKEKSGEKSIIAPSPKKQTNDTALPEEAEYGRDAVSHSQFMSSLPEQRSVTETRPSPVKEVERPTLILLTPARKSDESEDKYETPKQSEVSSLRELSVAIPDNIKFTAPEAIESGSPDSFSTPKDISFGLDDFFLSGDNKADIDIQLAQDPVLPFSPIKENPDYPDSPGSPVLIFDNDNPFQFSPDDKDARSMPPPPPRPSPSPPKPSQSPPSSVRLSPRPIQIQAQPPPKPVPIQPRPPPQPSPSVAQPPSRPVPSVAQPPSRPIQSLAQPPPRPIQSVAQPPSRPIESVSRPLPRPVPSAAQPQPPPPPVLNVVQLPISSMVQPPAPGPPQPDKKRTKRVAGTPEEKERVDMNMLRKMVRDRSPSSSSAPSEMELDNLIEQDYGPFMKIISELKRDIATLKDKAEKDRMMEREVLLYIILNQIKRNDDEVKTIRLTSINNYKSLANTIYQFSLLKATAKQDLEQKKKNMSEFLPYLDVNIVLLEKRLLTELQSKPPESDLLTKAEVKMINENFTARSMALAKSKEAFVKLKDFLNLLIKQAQDGIGEFMEFDAPPTQVVEPSRPSSVSRVLTFKSPVGASTQSTGAAKTSFVINPGRNPFGMTQPQLGQQNTRYFSGPISAPLQPPRFQMSTLPPQSIQRPQLVIPQQPPPVPVLDKSISPLLPASQGSPDSPFVADSSFGSASDVSLNIEEERGDKVPSLPAASSPEKEKLEISIEKLSVADDSNQSASSVSMSNLKDYEDIIEEEEKQKKTNAEKKASSPKDLESGTTVDISDVGGQSMFGRFTKRVSGLFGFGNKATVTPQKDKRSPAKYPSPTMVIMPAKPNFSSPNFFPSVQNPQPQPVAEPSALIPRSDMTPEQKTQTSILIEPSKTDEILPSPTPLRQTEQMDIPSKTPLRQAPEMNITSLATVSKSPPTPLRQPEQLDVSVASPQSPIPASPSQTPPRSPGEIVRQTPLRLEEPQASLPSTPLQPPGDLVRQTPLPFIEPSTPVRQQAVSTPQSQSEFSTPAQSPAPISLGQLKSSGKDPLLSAYNYRIDTPVSRIPEKSILVETPEIKGGGDVTPEQISFAEGDSRAQDGKYSSDSSASEAELSPASPGDFILVPNSPEGKDKANSLSPSPSQSSVPVQQIVESEPEIPIQSLPVQQVEPEVQPQPVQQVEPEVQPQPVRKVESEVQPPQIQQVESEVQPLPVQQVDPEVQPQAVQQEVQVQPPPVQELEPEVQPPPGQQMEPEIQPQPIQQVEPEVPVQPQPEPSSPPRIPEQNPEPATPLRQDVPLPEQEPLATPQKPVEEDNITGEKRNKSELTPSQTPSSNPIPKKSRAPDTPEEEEKPQVTVRTTRSMAAKEKASTGRVTRSVAQGQTETPKKPRAGGKKRSKFTPVKEQSVDSSTGEKKLSKRQQTIREQNARFGYTKDEPRRSDRQHASSRSLDASTSRENSTGEISNVTDRKSSGSINPLGDITFYPSDVSFIPEEDQEPGTGTEEEEEEEEEEESRGN